MDNGEYEIQKALGLTVFVSCEIISARYDQWGHIQKSMFKDIIFEAYPGSDNSEHLTRLAREWLAEQYPGYHLINVRILYHISKDRVGKYNGSDATP